MLRGKFWGGKTSNRKSCYAENLGRKQCQATNHFYQSKATNYEGYQFSFDYFRNKINVTSDTPLDQRDPKVQDPYLPSKGFVRFRLSKPKGEIWMMQPSLDNEAIECNPPAPVTGIQLIYKESKFRGSVALRIHSLTTCKYDKKLRTSGRDFPQNPSLFDMYGLDIFDKRLPGYNELIFRDENKSKDNPYTDIIKHVKCCDKFWNRWYVRYIVPITTVIIGLLYFCCKRETPPSFAIPMPAPPARDPPTPV